MTRPVATLLAGVLAGMATLSDAAAQGCVDYTQYVRPVARVVTDGLPSAVVAEGDLVYAALGTAGFGVLDLSDPANPDLLGTTFIPGWLRDVVVDGSIAYVSLIAGGLRVVDISDPSAPALMASFDSLGSRLDVDPDRDLLFLVNQTVLEVVDVSDPSAPVLVASHGLGAVDVVCVGDHLVAVDGALTVIDVTDPAAPSVVGSVDIPGSGSDLTVVDGIATVASGFGGLVTVDVSDPALPVVRSVLAELYPLGVIVVGSIAYLADDEGFRTVDVLDPDAPVLLGGAATSGQPLGAAVVGSRVVTASAFGSLDVFDVSNPASPPVVGSTPLADRGSGVAMMGAVAAVAAGGGGLHAIDLTDPEAPDPVGTWSAPSEVWDVVTEGPIAYVAGTASGVPILDLSDPTAPVELATLATSYSAVALALRGDHLLIADDHAGLQIADVGDPASPSIVAGLATPSRVVDVAVDGDLAVLAHFYGGGRLVDVSDPASPVELGTWTETTLDVAIDGATVYALDIGRIRAYDVSDPLNPVLLDTFEGPISDGTIRILGTTLYAAASTGGLLVIDVTDPSRLELIGGTWPDALGLALSGDWLVTVGRDALRVLPGHCRIPTAVDPAPAAHPGRTTWGAPNPFTTGTTIHVATTDRARIDVFDAASRHVRTLHTTAGDVRWDGRSTDGRETPAGVYLYRVTSDAGVERGRLLRLSDGGRGSR